MMKYILLFLFLPLFSTSQCLKANISILLDWSGSESGSELDIALASYEFIHSMPIGKDQVKVSITTFSEDSSGTYQTFMPLSSDIDKINIGLNELASYPAVGGTILSGALMEGMDQIVSDGRADVYNIIIIISDGEIFDAGYCSTLVLNYKNQIPNLSVFAVQIGNIGLTMAPMMLSPQNPIRLYHPAPSTTLSPISDDGYESLVQICGSVGRVSISSTSDLVKGLKKLDLCI